MAATKRTKPLSTNVEESTAQSSGPTGWVKSDDFLRDYLKDAREDMAWRRELEFRLMQLLMVFYPILGTAMVTLYQSEMKSEVYWILARAAVAFVAAALLFVTYRICREHKAYAAVGRIVTKVWGYFGLFDSGAYLTDDAILPERLKKGIGQGRGYIWSLALIWLIGIAVMVMIWGLATFKTP